MAMKLMTPISSTEPQTQLPEPKRNERNDLHCKLNSAFHESRLDCMAVDEKHRSSHHMETSINAAEDYVGTIENLRLPGNDKWYWTYNTQLKATSNKIITQTNECGKA